MNKEQFLAMSLPHKLKFNIKDSLGAIYYQTIDAIWYAREFEDKVISMKFILRPLSDLTKPITHKGETFVPIEKLREMNDGENIYIQDDYIGIDNGYACAYYLNDALKFVSVLIEWHFDIAGLIEKGEAIDVNTLPENPYK